VFAGRTLTLALLGIYRMALSPILLVALGPACRFEPSCSAYASAAITRHGVARGSWIALKRILRCRPSGGWGYDPVDPQYPADHDQLRSSYQLPTSLHPANQSANKEK
jgi:hypothetical protein